MRLKSGNDSPPWKSKLPGQLRDAARLRHCSTSTEEVCVQWVKRFILFHPKRHPIELGGVEFHQQDLKDGFGRVYLPHALNNGGLGAKSPADSL